MRQRAWISLDQFDRLTPEQRAMNDYIIDLTMDDETLTREAQADLDEYHRETGT